MIAHVAAGTNLGDRWGHLAFAVRALRARRIPVVAASRVWDSAPLGPPQPRYLNSVLAVEWDREPLALLRVLQDIERERGRLREVKWGPRTLDLDLVLCGGARSAGPELVLPHPGLPDRRFVLAPLAELAPEQPVPGTGFTVARLLARAPAADLLAVGLHPQ